MEFCRGWLSTKKSAFDRYMALDADYDVNDVGGACSLLEMASAVANDVAKYNKVLHDAWMHDEMSATGKPLKCQPVAYPNLQRLPGQPATPPQKAFVTIWTKEIDLAKLFPDKQEYSSRAPFMLNTDYKGFILKSEAASVVYADKKGFTLRL
ncbi:hypothetical protein HDU76_010634, partial [Blyttiomyces sp. JEL0837]